MIISLVRLKNASVTLPAADFWFIRISRFLPNTNLGDSEFRQEELRWSCSPYQLFVRAVVIHVRKVLSQHVLDTNLPRVLTKPTVLVSQESEKIHL